MGFFTSILNRRRGEQGEHAAKPNETATAPGKATAIRSDAHTAANPASAPAIPAADAAIFASASASALSASAAAKAVAVQLGQQDSEPTREAADFGQESASTVSESPSKKEIADSIAKEAAEPVTPHGTETLDERALRIARQMAVTPEYAESPVPPELLELTGDTLTRFCYASLRRQGEIRAADPKHHPLAVLNAGWTAARQAGAVRVYEGKLVFPLPALRADGRTPLEASLKRQPNAEDGKFPWFVSYINNFVKKPKSSGSELGRFAWMRDWDTFLQELADLALPERWDFCDEDAGERRNNILNSYLCTTFHRLSREGKVAITPDGSFAAFNTGLVDRRYDDIFACFIPSTGPIPREFAGFTTAGSRGLGKQLVSTFNPLPARAHYFERAEDLLYDPDRALVIDYEHIIVDNITRLPINFLEDRLSASPEAKTLLEDASKQEDETLRKQQFERLGTMIAEEPQLFRRVRSAIQEAVEEAERRVRWDFRTAVPSYYPRANTMSLLLPLSLIGDGKADAALVVELMPSGNYQGQTILTMRQAYTDARLIGRPDGTWLSARTASRNAA